MEQEPGRTVEEDLQAPADHQHPEMLRGELGLDPPPATDERKADRKKTVAA